MSAFGGRSFTIGFSEYGQALNILNSNKFTSITLHYCTKPLPASVIHLMKQTVTALTFSSMTSFTNIRICLQNLPRVKVLSFKDVLIDNKYSLPNTSKQYEIPGLKCLSFEHKLDEANTDVFLLQFFISTISMPNLEALSFMEDNDFGNETGMDGTKQPTAAVPAAPSVTRMFEEEFSNSRTSLHSTSQHPLTYSCLDEDIENEANVSVLARFLHEYYDKLKVLRFRDHCIQVGNPILHDSDHIAYVLLKLEEFVYSMDDPGQNFILTCQKSLSTLVASSLIYDFHIDKFDTFFYSVDRNFKTLTEIRLCPYIVLDESNPDSSAIQEKINSMLLIDCKVFQKCENLSTAEIDIKVLDNRANTSSDNGLGQCGTAVVKTVGILHNIHSFPATLQDLAIAGHTMCSKELDLLFLRLPDFTYLENLSIELRREEAVVEDCEQMRVVKMMRVVIVT